MSKMRFGGDPQGERFEDQLDQLLVRFRGQALDEVAKAQAEITADFRARQTADQMHYEAVIAEKGAEAQEYKRLHGDTTNRLEQKKQQLKQLLLLQQKLRLRDRRRHTAETAFLKWRALRHQHHAEKVQLRMSAKLHARRALQSFQAWKERTLLQRGEREAASLRAQLQTEKARLLALGELERQRVVEELEQARVLLREEQAAKRRLQEDLKSVFMRGVCTLNFEAMQLLNDRYVPPSGLVPPTAPAAEPSAPADPDPPADAAEQEPAEPAEAAAP